MGAKEFASLLGGLALFLYGMNMMSQGMEAAAGNKMKQILERLTTNRYLGVLVGAVITAIIQSSSATTVMVVGFVNSGMMTLRQAVGVIMGANIGTTITGQLIALDAGAIAPFIAFLGVVMVVFLKQPKVRNIGGIFLFSRCIRCAQKRDCWESVRFASERSRVRIPLGPLLAAA